jgi:hypothetical protein
VAPLEVGREQLADTYLRQHPNDGILGSGDRHVDGRAAERAGHMQMN